MRDSNYKSVPLNKAAVSITTNLYDRRALDATCDRPLVNSLNHLTFLTSSSAKVRETLASDGGLERLVCILHECTKDVSSHTPRTTGKTIAEEKHDALVAWKWTLAFQCLVLIGTRGTEKIRERVVQAGIIPIIATVLDNYLLVNRDFDAKTDTTLSEKFIGLVQQQLKQSQARDKRSQSSSTLGVEVDSLLSSYLSSNSELANYLSEPQQAQRSSPLLENGLHILQNISEMNIQRNLHDINQTITSPRFFLRGVLIPKDDDVVWSLQLLAFISKYSNLKSHLQGTHIVESLSLRTLLRTCPSPVSIPPALETDDDPEMELLSNLSSDESEQQSQAQSHSTQLNNHQRHSASQRFPPQLTQSSASSSQRTQEPQTQPQTANISLAQSQVLIQMNNNSNDDIMNDNDERGDGLVVKSPEYQNALLNDYEAQAKIMEHSALLGPTTQSTKQTGITRSLLNSILKFEKCCLRCSQTGQPSKVDIQDYTSNEEKTYNFIELSLKLNNFYSKQCVWSKICDIANCLKEKEEYLSKWCYGTYFLKNTADDDVDHSTDIADVMNIFPLVEKFTIKSMNTSDMCYWSGVIMRNSCRKAESGVRQCACFDCGKWEKSPRQFAKCRRCKRTKYCSKECQLKAWVYHKHWCVDSNSTSTTQSHVTGTLGDSSAAGAPGPDEIQPAQLTENL